MKIKITVEELKEVPDPKMDDYWNGMLSATIEMKEENVEGLVKKIVSVVAENMEKSK